jgi:hypothetical protein
MVLLEFLDRKVYFHLQIQVLAMSFFDLDLYYHDHLYLHALYFFFVFSLIK